MPRTRKPRSVKGKTTHAKVPVQTAMPGSAKTGPVKAAAQVPRFRPIRIPGR